MVPDSGVIGDILNSAAGRWLDERTIRCGARFLSCLWNDARGAKVVPVALIGTSLRLAVNVEPPSERMLSQTDSTALRFRSWISAVKAASRFRRKGVGRRDRLLESHHA